MASFMPLETTIDRMSRFAAPSARRTPISCALCSTEYRHQPVDANRRQQQRDRPENPQQQHVEILSRDRVGDHLIHRSDAGDGELTIVGEEFLFDWRQQACRRRASLDNPRSGNHAVQEAGQRVGDLRHRHIDERDLALIEAIFPDIVHDPDDLTRRVLEFGSESLADRDRLSDGVGLGPVLLGEGCIDHDDRRRASNITLVEHPAAPDRESRGRGSTQA